VGTVEEYYHWLQSAFVHTAFSPNTFDGATRRADVPAGRVLGANVILGAVRIAQLRAAPTVCPGPGKIRHSSHAAAPPIGPGSSGFRCFEWGEEAEAEGAFGHFTPPLPDPNNATAVLAGAAAAARPTPFLRNGIYATTGAPVAGDPVTVERGFRYSFSYTDRLHQRLGSPTHAVSFNPRDGLAANSAAVRNLTRSGFIDLQTRAVFVDLAVYNPQLDLVCQVRLIAEMPVGGGVMTSYEIEADRLYETVGAAQLLRKIVIGAFYGYYLSSELVGMWRWDKGAAAYLSRSRHLMMMINILLYVLYLYFFFHAKHWLPDSLTADSAAFYPEVREALQELAMATKLQATNTFLNWFKMITYLSYAPSFAVLTDTLSTAAPEILGFAFIFFVIFFGFAQAHAMVLNTKLEQFRSLGDAHFALMRSLLGDFDFGQLRDADPWMGPFFFVLFVGLAIFVILNMLIAIISDSYSVCREEMQAKPKVDLVKEVREYVTEVVLGLPVVGTMLRESHKAAEKSAKAVAAASHKSVKAVAGNVRKRASNLGVHTHGGLFAAVVDGVKPARPTQASLLAAVDADGDGLITKAELNDIDVDGDGVITREELESKIFERQLLATIAGSPPEAPCQAPLGRPTEAGPGGGGGRAGEPACGRPGREPARAGCGPVQPLGGAAHLAVGLAVGASASAARARGGARQQLALAARRQVDAAAAQLAAAQDLLRLADMLGDDTGGAGLAAAASVATAVTRGGGGGGGGGDGSVVLAGGGAFAVAEVLAVAEARKLLGHVIEVLAPGSGSNSGEATIAEVPASAAALVTCDL
jgi:hypothetical protein